MSIDCCCRLFSKTFFFLQFPFQLKFQIKINFIELFTFEISISINLISLLHFKNNFHSTYLNFNELSKYIKTWCVQNFIKCVEIFIEMLLIYVITLYF